MNNIQTLKSTIENIFDSPKKKSYYLVVFTMLIVLVLVIFAIQPTITKAVAIQKEIVENRKYLKKIDDKNLALLELINQSTSIDNKPSYDFFYDNLINYSKLEQSLDNFDLLAKDNGLQTVSFAADYGSELDDLEMEYASRFSKINMVLTLKGTASSFAMFYSQIEKYPLPIRITNIGLHKDENQVQNYTLNLTIYHLSNVSI